jgi:predicted RNase H-like HicB family nuclease
MNTDGFISSSRLSSRSWRLRGGFGVVVAQAQEIFSARNLLGGRRNRRIVMQKEFPSPFVPFRGDLVCPLCWPIVYNPVQELANTMNITTTVQIWREENQFVAHAMPIDVMSSGPTAEEARRALDEAVRLFVHTAKEEGTLKEVLDKCGYVG